MFTIQAFVGPNGGGKTLAAMHKLVLPAWRQGRPVVSNLGLYPERVGFRPELAQPLTSWRQIPDLRECVLLLDEITAVLPSRQFSSLPPQLGRVLNQLRKVDVVLGWTAPNWARADVLLREVSQAVTVCRGFWSDPWEREMFQGRIMGRRVRDADGEPMRYRRGWRPNRVFRWCTYDAIEFDEFTYSRVAKVDAREVQWHWRRWHPAFRAYDTLENVLLLDHLDDVGVCVGCGGSRSRPRCKCGPVAEGASAPKAAGAEVPG